MPDLHTSTGASPSELIDLERRIADRGLQLRRLPPGPIREARNPEVLSDYEETEIRVALLFMAERLAGRLWDESR